MVYLASSVVTALKEALNDKKAEEVDSLETVICPLSPCTIAKQDTCDKGKTGACKKKVDIMYYYNGTKNLSHLIIRYQLDGRRSEGFIRCEDRTLKNLLTRGVLEKGTLISA